MLSQPRHSLTITPNLRARQPTCDKIVSNQFKSNLEQRNFAVQGYLALKKLHLPQDHHRALGIGL